LEETDGFGVVRGKHRPPPPQAVWQGAQFLPLLYQPHLIQPQLPVLNQHVRF